MNTTTTPRTATATAGGMTLTVATDGARNWEGREVWSYTVSIPLETWEGDDLHTGVGFTASAPTMLATLCAFLEHYGEAYARDMAPDAELVSEGIPAWVQEACYMSADELAMTRYELDPDA